ncbi:MAG: efflux RND transporter permease subunit [Luteolibacter sp.]|jgi:multidrug efflux pump subunit AcrB
MIEWFARNSIAANFLLIAILLFGAYSAVERVPLEVQPPLKFNRIDVSLNYRGGTPEDVERAVVIPIENALQGLAGVAYVESIAFSGAGRVSVYLERKVDERELMEEIRTRVSRINTFPQELEPPAYRIPDSSRWFDVMKVAIAGEMEAPELLRAATRVRDDLTDIPGISQVNVLGSAPLEIAIEADPMRLRDFGLAFSDLGDAIRRSSLDVPAGEIRTDEGVLMIRTKGQALTREDFAAIAVRNRDGAEVLLGSVADVRDGFEEREIRIRHNGTPALMVEVLRAGNENALEIAAKVHRYVTTAPQRFPQGISLHVWDDSSTELRGRLGTLVNSLLMGSVLVLIVLGVFLRPMIALWVVIGIPVAFAGGFIMMPYFGLTSNVMSIFGFIIVVGIIVDDAIVTSENIYTKLREGMEPLRAVTVGAKEVTVPVTFGVLTTIVAFIPLMYFEGYYGSLTRQIPPVVGAVLIFSLIETKLCLPCHLKSVRVHRTRMNFFERFQKRIADGLEQFVGSVYEPTLRVACRHRYVTLTLFFACGMASLGFFQSGVLGFVSMPAVDRNRINAWFTMPRDTPVEVTDENARLVERAVEQLRAEFIDRGTGETLIGDVVAWSGGRAHRLNDFDARRGTVMLAVTDPGLRSEPGPKNSEIAARWQELVGPLPGTTNFVISGERGGWGENDLESLTVELRGQSSEEKLAIVGEIEDLLESYEGIAGAWSDIGGNRDELLITIRPEGEAIGLTQQDLGRQVRAAFFGEQAQRIQRDRDDIRVMVRLPLAQRQTLDTLDQLRIRTPSGGLAPFHSVASASFVRAPARIDRLDGAQIHNIHAQPVDDTVDVVAISRALAPQIHAIVNRDAELSWRYSGYVAQHEQTRRRSIIGGVALFLALYALLAIPFRSLYQPFFVMIAVPFGAIGALFGHVIMGITPSYLSVFGILALAGVVVNDSLVMVDFINRRIREGGSLLESVVGSGTRRFRPILLTSLTTFVGLLPLMFDPSLQAQFLIPMATSLAFGILFATVITLFLVPTTYLAAEDLRGIFRRGVRWYQKPFHAMREREVE